MKLTILGNNGPYPGANGACSGYLLGSDDGQTNILIECGTGVLSRLIQQLPLAGLSAVILSHLHYDHMSDMLPMQYALQFNPRTSPLPVYAPCTPVNVRSLLDVPAYALHDMQACEIGGMRISFMPVRHPVESHAVRIECDGRCFVYTGDTNIVPGLDSFARGADLLLADAGLSNAHWNENAPHLSAEACAQLAARAGVRRLLLTHLNPRYTPEELEAEACPVFKNTRFARIGESYTI